MPGIWGAAKKRGFFAFLLLALIIAPMLLLALLFAPLALAFQDYHAERDPPLPKAKEQYRLILRTPGRDCNTWLKVKAVLNKGDYQVTETKRDEAGKEPGCKFIWVILPEEAAGDMKFELQGITGPVESFVVPVAGGPRPAASNAIVGIGGIANENGTGPTTIVPKGRLNLMGVGVENSKPEEKK